MVHAAKMMKYKITDQNYRASVIWYLSKHIENDDLGSEDKEVLSIFSTFDRNHARIKVLNICDALKVLPKRIADNTAMTWKE